MSDLIDALNKYFVSEFGEDSEIKTIPEDGIIHLAYTKAFKLQDRVIVADQENTSVKDINYKEIDKIREDLKKMSIDYVDKILIEISGGGVQ